MMAHLKKAFALYVINLSFFACEKEEVPKDYSGEYVGINEYKSNKRYYAGPVEMIDTVYKDVHFKVVKGQTKGTWTIMLGDNGSPILKDFQIIDGAFSSRSTTPSTSESIIKGLLFKDSLEVVTKLIIHNDQWFMTNTFKAVKKNN
ncbi:hypothetical protein [Rufibacter tibetensis]|uniref:Uncharacterized protein n=1 Tax=Rufibacter tibetensis TaxID=512763 RepID=A0A0P0CF74_9BACT|nr:hypothetical protein [Rufibacter tibetensis]ALJ00518.1 hypothetical protein DC20_18015 [Rufibacter tibetensis]